MLLDPTEAPDGLGSQRPYVKTGFCRGDPLWSPSPGAPLEPEFLQTVTWQLPRNAQLEPSTA
jgi:hypothetical protein